MAISLIQKIILVAKRVSKATFDPIVSPWSNPEKVVFTGRLAEKLPSLVARYLLPPLGLEYTSQPR